MLARGGTSAGQDGSSNSECGTQCGSRGSESLVLNTNTSSRLMWEKYDQWWAKLYRITHPSNDHSGVPGTSNTASASTRSAATTVRASQIARGMSWGGGDSAR